MDRRQIVFTNLVTVAAITWCGLDETRRYLVPPDIAHFVETASNIPPEFLPLDLDQAAHDWVHYSEGRGSLRYKAEAPDWLKRYHEAMKRK